jgi:sugar-specific transcriptional regulator TrmB
VTSTHERCIAELRSLGLSVLEGTVYLHLLRHPRSTGYRVAQELGKPAANVYAALESLRRKGALVVDTAAGNRVFRALPADGLRRVFEERFHERTRRLADVLALWQGAGDDGGIYQLAEPEQVYAQAQAMLARARSVVIADLFPGPLARLAQGLEKAAARGVPVAAQVYAPASLRGVETVMSHRGRKVIERWPGQWLSLVTDGSEYLVALLSADGEAVEHSTWTKSPHLAWTSHSALSGDLIATRLIAALEQGETVEALRSLARRLQRRLRSPNAAGYRRLVGGTKSARATRAARPATPARRAARKA